MIIRRFVGYRQVCRDRTDDTPCSACRDGVCTAGWVACERPAPTKPRRWPPGIRIGAALSAASVVLFVALEVARRFT